MITVNNKLKWLENKQEQRVQKVLTLTSETDKNPEISHLNNAHHPKHIVHPGGLLLSTIN